jgi:uncharacterized protein (TIGR02996 family)
LTFDAFISQLSQRPQDEGLRATFADWLLEQGDPRGEAMALEGRNKRRLEALRKKHAKAWLGELAEHADIAACVFRGGFPVKLELRTPAPPPKDLSTLTFVEDVTLHAPATALLERLPGLKRLTADVASTVALGAGRMPWTLEHFELRLEPRYATFRELAGDLDRVAEVAAIRRRPLSISVPIFMEPVNADFIAEAVLRSGLAERDVLGLDVRQGALDAVSHWLAWAPSWGGGTQWEARFEGLHAAARRDDDDRFRLLHFELDDASPRHVAVAAAILSQLQALTPTRIDVTVPAGVRARKAMLDTLQAARRLLPSVSKLRVVQKKR